MVREYRPNVLNLVDGMLEDYSNGDAPSMQQLRTLRKWIQEQSEELRAERARHAALRSLLPDVMALAQWAIETEHMSDHVNTDQIGDVGRRILAALETKP